MNNIILYNLLFLNLDGDNASTLQSWEVFWVLKYYGEYYYGTIGTTIQTIEDQVVYFDNVLDFSSNISEKQCKQCKRPVPLLPKPPTD